MADNNKIKSILNNWRYGSISDQLKYNNLDEHGLYGLNTKERE